MDVIVEIAKSEADQDACLALRRQVFIQEQNVPEHEEVDGEDDICVHILATLDGAPVGAARYQMIAEYAKIQRVCVPRTQRGSGVGVQMMRFIADHIGATTDVRILRLGAQIHALKFYENLGYGQFGAQYLDAGIAHMDMELRLS